MIDFDHYDLKLTKNIIIKNSLILFGFNRKLDGGGLFAHFQYINVDITWFYRFGIIEIDPIVKKGKCNLS
jgi:hypothetical protein